MRCDHTIDPVADSPCAPSRTQLHGKTHMLTQKRGSFMGMQNITAIEHGWTQRLHTRPYQHGLLTSTRTQRNRGITPPLRIILSLTMPYQNHLHQAVSSWTPGASA